ncbi:MAG TPA: dTDP-4-dehydrorhamnose reductase [Terriglobales bacterium]|jgi:dTDP-4-dehydrorhamnose reductase|nr:dTDP-4-dehydrorhamnose reductase [Terriglobales bacterium]
MKIAIIGANGQVGHDLITSFSEAGDQILPLTHAEIEIANLGSVRECLEGIRPDVVVNTAAMHHVENCETQPEAAYAVNAVGARNLASVTKKLGATLVHLSTDYVFDGSKDQPYVETDLPRPLNVYGNTKLAGEYFVRAENPKHFVLRTSALYGTHPCRAKGGLNFVELMLKLARERGKVRVVDSEIVSPTSTAELSRQIVALSRSDAFGLYHSTGEGACSWHAFAAEVFDKTGTKVDLQVAAPDEFPIKVPRPKYSVLENSGLKRLKINQFKPWQQALNDYLSRQSDQRVSA